jgi:hypothetical protein
MLDSKKNLEKVSKWHQLDRIFAIYSIVFEVRFRHYIAVVLSLENKADIFYRLQDNAEN